MIDCGGCCGSALPDRCGRSGTPRVADSSGPERSGPPERRAAVALRTSPRLEPPPPAFRLAAACSAERKGRLLQILEEVACHSEVGTEGGIAERQQKAEPSQDQPGDGHPLPRAPQDSAPRMMPTTETGNPHSGKNQAHRLAIPRISEPMANPLRLGVVDCGCMNLLL